MRNSAENHFVNRAGLRAAVLVLFLLASCVFPQGIGQRAGTLTVRAEQASPEEGEGDDSGLVIEVVGEHSIDDEVVIEDEEVPLAMFGEEPADAGPVHAAMMALVLCCSIGYVLYFRRYEEKLFLLRREAARAQKRLMDAREDRPEEI